MKRLSTNGTNPAGCPESTIHLPLAQVSLAAVPAARPTQVPKHASSLPSTRHAVQNRTHLHCIWSLVISSSSIDSSVRAATGAAAAAAAAVATSRLLLVLAAGRLAGTVTVALTAGRVTVAGGRPLPLLLPLLGAVGGA